SQPSSSGREQELEERLATCHAECQELAACVRSLNDQLAAQVAEAQTREADLQRRAEAVAAERQQALVRLEAAYQSAGVGLCLLDSDLRVLLANDRWHDMTREAGVAETALAAMAPLTREALRIRSATRNGN